MKEVRAAYQPTSFFIFYLIAYHSPQPYKRVSYPLYCSHISLLLLRFSLVQVLALFFLHPSFNLVKSRGLLIAIYYWNDYYISAQVHIYRFAVHHCFFRYVHRLLHVPYRSSILYMTRSQLICGCEHIKVSAVFYWSFS